MKPLADTNIVVNHNLFTEAERNTSRAKARRDFERSVARNPALRAEIDGEREEMRQRGSAYSEWRTHIAEEAGVDRAKLLDEISRAKQSSEGDAYEREVHALLLAIRGNPIGRLVMDCMSARFRVWVTPIDEALQTVCTCVAATSGRMKAEDGGGVRVRFTPIPGDPGPNGRYSNEDILFHELVHAYRSTVVANADQWTLPMREYKSEEEVIAVHTTNVFRSSRGHSVFYQAHLVSPMLSKPVMYRYFAEDDDVFDVMQAFLQKDTLAKRLAKTLPPVFNPWRDFAPIAKANAADRAKRAKAAKDRAHLIDL